MAAPRCPRALGRNRAATLGYAHAIREPVAVTSKAIPHGRQSVPIPRVARGAAGRAARLVAVLLAAATVTLAALPGARAADWEAAVPELFPEATLTGPMTGEPPRATVPREREAAS